MAKLKSIVFVAGVMLLILAAAVGYLSIKYLAAILPADSYEDKGVYTFSPLSSPARPGAEHGGQRTRPPHEPHQNRLHGLLPGHQRERLSVEPAGPHPRAGPGDRGRGGRCGAAGAVRPR